MFGKHRREKLQQLSDSVPFWWHSIDFGHGVVTPGYKTPDILSAEFDAMRLPNLTGKTLLDIGAWDGFFSFEAERRGASRIAALDHYAWSLDLVAQNRYIQECQNQGVAPLPYHTVPELWHPHLLPGKKGFDAAQKAINSRVEAHVADFMTVNPDDFGIFDIVLFLGVLYHMENPLKSLRQIARLTGELAVIETVAVVVPGFETSAMWEFYPSSELNGDVSNWWSPNIQALHGICQAAGFRRVETMIGPPDEAGLPQHEVSRYRATIHAWK